MDEENVSKYKVLTNLSSNKVFINTNVTLSFNKVLINTNVTLC